MKYETFEAEFIKQNKQLRLVLGVVILLLAIILFFVCTDKKYFVLKNYKVAGKTGTAQIPFEGKYDPNKTNATFVGFLPTSKKFSMLVKLQEPRSSIYAAETAVPLWMGITDDLVRYFGLPPDKDPVSE